MKRTYENGITSNARYFIGTEVEHTIYHNKKTLFIVGKPDPYHIIEKILQDNGCQHYFFGANNSFHPQSQKEVDEYSVCMRMLSMTKPVSIDVGVEYMPMVIKSQIPFIPGICIQIKVPVPHITNLNSVTYIKIDDTGFNESNKGVWTIPLEQVIQNDYFTNWTEYNKDTILAGV